MDYQNVYWTSPVTDLLYFFHTSLSPDLLDKYHILVQEYHKSLTETLSALGYRGLQPTLTELHMQLQKRGPYAMVMCCSYLSNILADRNNAPDVLKVIKKEEVVHLSEEYKDIMKQFLPIFEEKGWL